MTSELLMNFSSTNRNFSVEEDMRLVPKRVVVEGSEGYVTL